jgi:hypothetical protein
MKSWVPIICCFYEAYDRLLQLQSRLEREASDKKRRAERKRRHLIEDLRYAMKKVEPPIDLDGTYEAVSDMRYFAGCTELVWTGDSGDGEDSRV